MTAAWNQNNETGNPPRLDDRARDPEPEVDTAELPETDD